MLWHKTAGKKLRMYFPIPEAPSGWLAEDTKKQYFLLPLTFSLQPRSSKLTSKILNSLILTTLLATHKWGKQQSATSDQTQHREHRRSFLLTSQVVQLIIVCKVAQRPTEIILDGCREMLLITNCNVGWNHARSKPQPNNKGDAYGLPTSQ